MYDDTDELDDQIEIDPQHVRMSAHSVWRFEPLPPIGDIPQTRAIFTIKTNLAGAFPTKVINVLGPRFLTIVSMMRQKFDRSRDLDLASRLQIVEKLRSLQVKNGNSFDLDFLAVPGAEKVGGTGKTMVKIDGDNAWGTTVFTVKCDLEEVAAYFWDFESRASNRSDVRREVLEKVSDFEIKIRRRQRMDSKHHGHHHDREYMNVMKLIKVDEDTIVIRLVPLAQSQRRFWRPTRGISGTHVAEETATLRIKRQVAKEIRIELVTRLHLGTFVSKATKRATLLEHMSQATAVAHYFNDLLPSALFDDEDAKLLGCALMNVRKQKGKTKNEIVKAFAESNLALGELSGKYEFIEPMVESVLESKLTTLAKVKGKAEVLSAAGKIGR